MSDDRWDGVNVEYHETDYGFTLAGQVGLRLMA